MHSFNRLNHVSSVFWNPDMNKALNSEVTAFVMSCNETKAKKEKEKKQQMFHGDKSGLYGVCVETGLFCWEN